MCGRARSLEANIEGRRVFHRIVVACCNLGGPNVRMCLYPDCDCRRVEATAKQVLRIMDEEGLLK